MTIFDLHCHSTASDGRLSPTDLVARAHEHGVSVLALTDHDTVAGHAEAALAASACGLQLVPGIELSTRWDKHTMHVVGLGVDPRNPVLLQHVEWLGEVRRQRARDMGAKLAKLGFTGVYEQALAEAGEAEPTRPHFARALVEAGHVQTEGEAFKRYLRRGKPGYATAAWPDLEQTIAVIREAGGMAVLAHPHGYGWTGAWVRRILEAFVGCGGEALEVVCGGSTPNDIRDMSGHARRFGLYASQGSDFHSPATPWIELGRLAPMPADLKPVWQAPQVAAWLAA